MHPTLLQKTRPTQRGCGLLVALLLATQGSTALAAGNLGGLNQAFRPSNLPPGATSVTATPSDATTGDGATGLRVVVKRGNQAHATIDGRVVRVGDTVNGMRVTRISEQGVSLAGPDRARQDMTISPQVQKRWRNSDAAPAQGTHPTMLKSKKSTHGVDR